MKIAIVIGRFPTVTETFIVNQIVSLIDKGHHVVIYALKKGDFKQIQEVVLQYKLLDKVSFREVLHSNKIIRVSTFIKWVWRNKFDINWGLLLKSINFLKYGKTALSLELFNESQYFILKENQFDVIHAHFRFPTRSIANLKEKGFFTKTKFVISFHGVDMNPSKIEFYKTYYKILFEQVDSITVNTIYLKNILLQVERNLTNIVILPVGLDTFLFKNEEEKQQKSLNFKILYCGRLIKLKGVDLAVEIFAELFKRGYKNIVLEIIGDGELKTDIEEFIKVNNFEKNIFLKGKQTQREIINSLENTKVFLFPGIKNPSDGRCEAQGLVVQEAQAMKVPVVVSDVGGIKYGLRPNETGFVIKEQDIKGFADAIQTLIENPKMVKKMGENGRDFVVENYDSRVLVNKLLDIYKS